MSRITYYLLSAALLLVLSSGARADDRTNEMENRLRDGMRNAMLQLRDAQTQIATLQAAQADSDQKNKTLSAQLDAQKKQAISDRQVAAKTIADLTAEKAELTTQVTELEIVLQKWKDGYNKYSALARDTEAKRSALATQVIMLDRKVADQQTKNQAMYELGKEILLRYDKFGLGDALTAKEPFVGITRVKFENLIQDYSDKIADQKIKQ